MKIKKFSLLFICVFLLLIFASCNKKENKETTAIETEAQTDETKDEEEKKVEEEKPVTGKDAAYAFGLLIGKSAKELDLDLNSKALVKGFKEALAGKTDDSKIANAERILNKAFYEAHTRRIEKNLTESKKFMEENKTREGVITTESGLQYEVLADGEENAEMPVETDIVKVNYKGMLLDTTVFDDSSRAGKPIDIGLNQVIPGWREGLMLMKKGAKYKMYIPPELGYGEQGISQGGNRIIPENAVLVFEIELVDIVKAEKEAE